MLALDASVSICPNGHRWPAHASMTFRSGEQNPRCPECGEPAERSRPTGEGGERSAPPPPPPAAAPGSRQVAARGPPGPGGTRAEVVAGQSLGFLAAAQLAETLAHALHGAHQHGLVHGHLSPANIQLVLASSARFVNPDLGQLADESGRELVPRITDFGSPGAWERAHDGPSEGLPSYKAPEQAGRGDASPSTDVYALGAILYHLLTGRPPFEAATPEETWRLVLEGTPIPPSGWNPKVPGDLEAICLACLEKDPSRRLPDALALADALRQVLDSYGTHFQCGRCRKSLKSSRPLRGGSTMVRCPRCGVPTPVEAIGGKAPSGSTPAPAPAPTAIDTKAQTRRATPSRLDAWTPAAPPTGPLSPSPSPSSPSYLSCLPEVAGYTILGELGRGGMGVVFKARQEKLKRVVALKMILVDPKSRPQYLARFQAEAEAVARLHHPNIVQIFEVGEQDGWPYLALEFVTGGTLKKRLDGQPQPSRATAQLVQQLARAVHAAHQRGIVHLDLKPANILLEPAPLDDDRDEAREAAQLFGVPKVNDFGLARRIDHDLDPVRNGEVLGTPLYMAPEQAKGQADEVGPAADVYSLGVLLYEMLTGRTPF